MVVQMLLGVEYNEEATIDNGTCLNIAVYGCVYIFANNYNSQLMLMMVLVCSIYLVVQIH